MIMMKRKWIIAIVIFSGLFFSTCKDQEDLNQEISCHKSVIEGNWDVESEYNQYFEVQDSTTVQTINYTAVFSSDGTGITESSLTGYITWSLQCIPNRLLVNGINAPLEEEDRTNYVAFSNIYELTRITTNEINMSVEYYLGSNETRRRINQNIVYKRIQ
jgi:hypothetical protein